MPRILQYKYNHWAWNYLRTKVICNNLKLLKCISFQLCVDGNPRQGNCPGICAALHDCGSCTVQGQGADLTHSNNIGLFQNEKCAWCVKESQCQRLSGMFQSHSWYFSCETGKFHSTRKHNNLSVFMCIGSI